MKYKKILSIMLALLVGVSLGACNTQESEPAQQPSARVAVPEVLRAITVGTQNSAEYPGSGKVNEQVLRQKAVNIVSFAADAGMNAILYKATPYGEAAYPSKVLEWTQSVDFSTGFLQMVDPLEILIDCAREKGIAVYAMISPYEAGRTGEKPRRKSIAKTTPDAVISMVGGRHYKPDHPAVHDQAVAVAAELADRYAVTGVVLTDVDDAQVQDYQGFYTYLNALTADVSDAVRAANRAVQVGLMLSSGAEGDTNRTQFIGEICRSSIDFLTAEPQGGDTAAVAKSLTPILASARAGGAQLYTAIVPDASSEVCGKVLFAANQLGMQGGIAGDYTTLKQDDAVLDTVIPMLYMKGSILPDYTLEAPKEFRITRPLDGARLSIDTTWEKYYITGTSDPQRQVLFEGTEVKRIGKDGLFGVLVDVKEGENVYTFEQGGQTLTATLYRPEPGAKTKISKISTYVSKSDPGTAVLQPYGPQAISDILPMLFQCTAPSGAKVTAALNGNTYELEQTARTDEEGTPVIFRKEVRIPAKDPDSIVSIGTVTYTLDYQGETSQAQAPGEVYLVGANRKALFRVEEGMGTVLGASMKAGDFLTTLKTGSVGEIVGQTANYFKTPYGGSILKKSTSIVTDLQSAQNVISSVEFIPADSKGDEKLILHGSVCPSFIVDASGDGNFTIRFIDTTGIPEGKILADSQFFSSIQVKNGAEASTITFKKSQQDYFGYNVTYDGTNTILSFKAKPHISSLRGRPLDGMIIVLDPGHGAQDVGAFGIPGETGPAEKNTNLYAAQITRRLLEGLGADVRMTRESDEDFLELDERVAFAEHADADLFISMHHNSAVENISPERLEGVWVYYYNDISKDISQFFLDQITKKTGRRANGTESGWYVVNRNTLAPSVLLELGFMPNPKEYEAILQTDNMLAVARGVCEAVVEYVSSL